MASTYLSKTFSTGDNRKKWTWSAWIKRSNLGSDNWLFHAWVNSSNENSIFFDSSDRLAFSIYEGATNNNGRLTTTRKFRDTSAWFHIQCVWDSANATATDRMIIYVNGERETSFDTQINATLNYDSLINSNNAHYIGQYGDGTSSMRFSGCMTHSHFIDGTAYDASTFGETDATTGIWKPKTAPSVTYGTNGFFLKFENSGSMGTDSSGNANNFTVNGTMTQTVDTPSNVFATFNPLIYMPNIPTFENGNLYVKGHDANYCEAISTLSMPKKGKWYAEFQKVEINNSFMVGIGNTNNIIEALRTNTNISPSGGGYSGGAVTIRDAGDLRQTNVSDISGFFPSSIANTDIIGLAIDLDNGAVYAHKNGTYGVISSVTGDPTSGASKTGAIDISGQAWYQNADFICFLFGNISGSYKDWCKANFGSGYFSTTPVASAGSNGNGAIFEYDVPTGYYALNTKNLATYG